jgi:transposase
MAYSKDFRKRAIEYIEEGHTGKELYEAFKIYPSEVNKWKKLLKEKGSLEPQYKKTRVGKIDAEKLAVAAEEKPEAYLREHAKAFKCTKQAVHYALKRLRVSNKKNIYAP